MRQGIGKTAKSKAEAQRNVSAFKGVVRGVKNYGKNVVGGAKIVGSAVKRGINKIGTKIADDLFASEAVNRKQREEARKLNEESSGRAMLKKAMKKFKK